MRYDEKSGKITLTMGEAVSLSMAKSLSAAAAERAGGALPVCEGGGLVLSAEIAGLSFDILCDACVRGDALCLSRTLESDPRRLGRAMLARLRGECFLSALAYLRGTGEEAVEVVLSLSCPALDVTCERRERVTGKDAETFFEKVAAALPLSGLEELDRATRRLPTLRQLPFPYPAERESQREMIEECYRAVLRGRRVFIEAPTGTGKTAGALYPALRALGEGRCDRVFYLTPKTTTAAAAAEALSLFHRAGGALRAVVLTAKERACPEGLLCRGTKGVCRRSRAGGAREEEAAAYLLSLDKVPVTYAEISEAANRFGVCPYELSLRYSLFADVIVGDYNYLFDTRVYLQRYFERGGDYLFLIDEAHDLLDRAREMYSATLSGAMLARVASLCEGDARLVALGELVGEAQALFARRVGGALSDGQSHTDRAGVLHRFASEREMPEELFAAASRIADEALALADPSKMKREVAQVLREAAYPLRDAALRARLYGEGYECFYEEDGGEAQVRLVCLDPSREIARRLSLGRAAVLFSATLSPLSYFRTVLGGGRDARELSLSSPFDADRLSIAIMDTQNTRYTAREESIQGVAEAVYGMVSARVGNYFVFCPSYAYLERLYTAFRTTYPDTRAVMQKKNASLSERDAFLSRFAEEPGESLVGFCVTGGVFAEGIDLVGTRLIGAAVVGVSLPQPSPERDAMAAYYEDRYEAGREYAYTYPGMSRVLQAAGRVIRTESDRGVLLLIDDRFADPFYRAMLPPHFRGMRLADDGRAVHALFSRFWRKK